ncbi:hypothetical protein T484DRAFT_1756203 [Baffinella frigidus]|nr:hypothetical protein T484DRAFT_1756203 [Cryptophyta sp. CCMP2293]
MPVWATSLLAALASMEDSFQRVPEATPPVCLDAHDEQLLQRHWATRSASKAPVEAKLTSSWDLPESFKIASSSGSTAASIAPTSSSESVDAAFGVEYSLEKDDFLVRAAGWKGRRASQ